MKIREYRPMCWCSGVLLSWGDGTRSGRARAEVDRVCVFHRRTVKRGRVVTATGPMGSDQDDMPPVEARPTVTHATRWWPFRWPWRSA